MRRYEITEEKLARMIQKQNNFLDKRHTHTLEKINDMRELILRYDILKKHNLGEEGETKKSEICRQYTLARDEALKGLTNKMRETTEFYKFPRNLGEYEFEKES